ncbi:MAG: dTDP-4-dehydrorhamnose 3,5-epimerase [Actinobacteria bacterium 13_2_20CM_2_71_6]|nr:MAG: dTDP-4-dehydrorhamnose 3,5-epimerase [Actinobacteria bacterium 13_2_20CM_2_71_6]
MEIRELAVPHALRVIPEKLPDTRGCFYEAMRRDELAAAVGHPFDLAQVNFSVSRRGVLRGIHSVSIPPGQAKFLTCVRGAVLDLVVDIRLGSPTFGVCDTSLLTAENGVGVYVAEGLGHGFVALTDDACVQYLCSTPYIPGTPFDVHALDPELDLPWGLEGPPLMSPRDAAAPTLAEAIAKGLLPTYQECLDLYARLRAGDERRAGTQRAMV